MGWARVERERETDRKRGGSGGFTQYTQNTVISLWSSHYFSPVLLDSFQAFSGLYWGELAGTEWEKASERNGE